VAHRSAPYLWPPEVGPEAVATESEKHAESWARPGRAGEERGGSNTLAPQVRDLVTHTRAGEADWWAQGDGARVWFARGIMGRLVSLSPWSILGFFFSFISCFIFLFICEFPIRIQIMLWICCTQIKCKIWTYKHWKMFILIFLCSVFSFLSFSYFQIQI
jgi:hypothetical protein